MASTSRLSRPLIPTWLWPDKKAMAGQEHPLLVKFGLLLIFAYLGIVFSPDNVLSNLRLILWPSSLVWLGMVLNNARRRPRFGFLFYSLMAMQIWMCISMLVASQSIEKPLRTGLQLWFPIELGMIYVLVCTTGDLMPRSTRYMINYFLAICTLSAFVAFLQGIHFTPAISLARYYVYTSLENWDGIPGVRASGLCNNPNANALSLIVAMLIVAYKSTLRRLTWVDWGMYLLFVAGAFLAQHRSTMPVIALCFFFGLAIIFKNERHKFYGSVAISFCVFAVAAIFLRHTFAYTFETQWSSNTPEAAVRILQANKAYEAYERFPITGIGPSAAALLISGQEDIYGIKVENMYYGFLVCFGLPGLLILAYTLGGAFVLSLTQYFNKLLSLPARTMALCGALGAFVIIWNGIASIPITQYHVIPSFLLLAGLVQVVVSPQSALRKRIKVSPYLQAGRSSGLFASRTAE